MDAIDSNKVNRSNSNKMPCGWANTELGIIVRKVAIKVLPTDMPDSKFIGMDSIAPNALKPHLFYSFCDFKSAGNKFNKDQILYGRMRPYLNKVFKASFTGVCSGEFIVLDCLDCLNPDYLMYLLHHRGFVRFANSKTTGDRPRVTFEDLMSYPALLPPLAEQKRIVARIEELFSSLDAGVASLKKAQAQLKIYRQSVLKWAFEGRLSNPDVKAGELPEHWKWETTSNVFEFVTSGSRGWAKYYSNIGAIFLRMGNLDHDTVKLDLSDIQYVKLPSNIEGKRTRVQTGDILISITADVGMIGLVTEAFPEAYINQHVALARPDVGKVLPRYLAIYLSGKENGQKQLKNLQRGATKVGLGLDDIKSVRFPLPPLSDQALIVAEIESRLSVCDKLEESIARSLEQAGALRQSILKKAFEGRLVPQDPYDEPASVLLERIRAERE